MMNEPEIAVQEREEAGTDSEQISETSEACTDLPLTARIEAVLISSDRALSDARLAGVLGLSGQGITRQIRDAVAELNETYEADGRPYRIEQLAGGYQILTLPEYGPLLRRLHKDRVQGKLSQAALETLAIIAYRQPLMRAEIEAIRGVASGEVLRTLIDRRLVLIAGRAEELGRPMLYGTTREFLKVFGLRSTEDLPAVEGLNPVGDQARASKPTEDAPPVSPETEVVQDEPDAS